MKVLLVTAGLSTALCWQLSADLNEQWDFDPEQPQKVENLGFYAIAKERISIPHPEQRIKNELTIKKQDVFPFLGFQNNQALLRLGRFEIKLPKDILYYDPKTPELEKKYQAVVLESQNFLSKSDRYSMLMYLREKSVVKSVREAESWPDDRILDTYLRIREMHKPAVIVK
jgi:hypothetical protein